MLKLKLNLMIFEILLSLYGFLHDIFLLLIYTITDSSFMLFCIKKLILYTNSFHFCFYKLY